MLFCCCSGKKGPNVANLRGDSFFCAEWSFLVILREAHCGIKPGSTARKASTLPLALSLLHGKMLPSGSTNCTPLSTSIIPVPPGMILLILEDAALVWGGKDAISRALYLIKSCGLALVLDWRDMYASGTVKPVKIAIQIYYYSRRERKVQRVSSYTSHFKSYWRHSHPIRETMEKIKRWD